MATTNYDRLRDAVIETVGLESIADVANHGCSGGVGGLCYYTETTAFFDKHEDAIMDVVDEFSSDMGYKGLPEFLSSMNAHAVGSLNTITTIKNALVWFAVEHICQEYVDHVEADKETCRECGDYTNWTDYLCEQCDNSSAEKLADQAETK